MNYCIPAFACLLHHGSLLWASARDGFVPTSSHDAFLNHFLNDYRNLTNEDLCHYFEKHCKDILNKYLSLSTHQKDLFNFLFSLPPESYLNIWESIADHLNPGNSSHMIALNDLFNDPIYGYTKSFFGLNWKQKSIRDICEQLKNKLKGNLSWTNDLNSILKGEVWKDVTRNGLNDMLGKLPSAPLPRQGYSAPFQHWTGDKAVQEKLIQELAEAHTQFTQQIWETKTEQDLGLLYQKGLTAMQIAEELFELPPPPSEGAQHRLGKLYHEKVHVAGYKKGMTPPPDMKNPEQFYRQFLILVENHPNMKLLMEQYPEVMTSSPSYLLEEALYLERQESRNKD